jgi:hypothetical protein
MLLKGAGSQDDDEPVEILACTQGSQLEREQATAFRYAVQIVQQGKEWSLGLTPLKGQCGNQLMRPGEDDFGRCQLQSLVRVKEAQEWGGKPAIRLGFTVIEA